MKRRRLPACRRRHATRRERVLGHSLRGVRRRTGDGRVLAIPPGRRVPWNTGDRPGGPMITDDRELSATLERIVWFQHQVAHLRRSEPNPANYHAAVSGFLAELDRMQREVREFLSLHPTERPSRLATHRPPISFPRQMSSPRPRAISGRRREVPAGARAWR